MKIIEHNDGSRGEIIDGLEPYYGEYDEILDILDFPLESLGDDTLTDWDASNSQDLGPIPLDAFMGFYQTNIGNESVIKSPCQNRNALISIESEPKAHADSVVTDFNRNNASTSRQIVISAETSAFQTRSPISVLESSGTCSSGKSLPISFETVIPVRARSKRERPSNVNQWFMKTPIACADSVAKKSSNSIKAKRPSTSELSNAPQGLPVDLNHTEKRATSMQRYVRTRSCTHCNVRKTPQWREGPLGKNTLCNACGVRYRSGCLFPEYRPAASPTFTPSLHSNRVKAKKRPRTSDLPNAPQGPRISLQQAMMGLPEDLNLTENKVTSMPLSIGTRSCTHCNVTKTPRWREGPLGNNTLCNACEVCYHSGNLLPVYRPASSPTFTPSLHSNSINANKRPRTSELPNAPEGPRASLQQAMMRLPEDLSHAEKKITSMQRSAGTKRCKHGNLTKTPQWREGPLACAVSVAKKSSNSIEAKNRPRTSELSKSLEGLEEDLNHTEKKTTSMKRSVGTRSCTHCNVTKTPQWREGPLGRNSLCNACGVRYRTGRLFPEYRPAASPMFTPSLHSNLHKQVIKMRKNATIHESVQVEISMPSHAEFLPTE